MRKRPARRPVLGAMAAGLLGLAAVQAGSLVDLGEQLAAFAAPAALLDGCTDVPEAVALAETLRLRGIGVDRALEDLGRRKDEIAAAEERLKLRLGQLRDAKKALTETRAAGQAGVEDGIDRLIAVYDAMKPAEAGRVLAALPPDFAAEILVRVQPETGARIIAAIDPGQAAILTTHMGARRPPSE